MAEYLSPGVYVEEFESGGKPMEGVGTSTAGFIGLAEKGPIEGVPQLVTNFSEFKRTYGGYLSENEFGEYRFLAYAVENFFINGGSRCFVSRVAPSDAKVSVGYAPSKDAPLVNFSAKNPGIWGDSITVTITPASKAKTQIREIIKAGDETKYLVKNGAGFNPGDVVVFTDDSGTVYNRGVKNQDNIITFAAEFSEDVADNNLVPVKTISTCEFTLEAKHGDSVELYENVSFNISAANFISKKVAKSDLIVAEYVAAEDEEIVAPFLAIAGEEAKVAVISFADGSNGSVSSVTAAEFIGVDNGAGKRTGIQSFVDNDVVSIMAVPGVTDPNVQLTLVAHCENLASRFAVLDLPRDAKKVNDIITHRNIFDSNYAALYHPGLRSSIPWTR